MKAAPFEYHAPGTRDELVSLLSRLDDAELVAGNQSLSIVVNNRVATPNHLIDLGSVPGLDGIQEDEDVVRIGAMVTHREIERSSLLDRVLPILPESAAEIAGPAVRNRGTMGGSLAEADPAGNYPTVLRALDATLSLSSIDGSRTVSVHEFLQGPMMTALEADEFIEWASVPTDAFPPGRSGMAFHELKAVPHTWPTLSAAATIRVSDVAAEAPVVEEARLALGNAAEIPLRIESAEATVEGTTLGESTLDAAVTAATNAVRPTGEVHADPDYKEDQAGVFAERALRTAYERATNASDA